MKRYLPILLFFYSCTSAPVINSISINRLNEIENIDEISAIEYLQISSSIRLLDSIFEKRDTTFKLFKPVIKLGVNIPVITLDDGKDFKNWINKEEMDLLKRLSKSNQSSYHITKTDVSLIDTTLSTVGVEAQFLIDLSEGRNKLRSD